MEGRNALKLIYFASLIISSILPQSFLIRWLSMILLSASLVSLLMMKVGKMATPLPDPKSFYNFINETRMGKLTRTSDIIRRASIGYSFAREMVVERILDILAHNFPIASKNEIRRDPRKYIPSGPLLDLLEGKEEVKGSEYLNLLELALKQIDIRGEIT